MIPLSHTLLSASLVVSCLLTLPGAQAADTAPRADGALTDWSFQPGVQPEIAPDPADWAAVTLPFDWTPVRGLAELREAARGKSWESLDLNNLNNGWMETQIMVPANLHGQRLYLSFTGLHHFTLCTHFVFSGKF